MPPKRKAKKDDDEGGGEAMAFENYGVTLPPSERPSLSTAILLEKLFLNCYDKELDVSGNDLSNEQRAALDNNVRRLLREWKRRVGLQLSPPPFNVVNDDQSSHIKKERESPMKKETQKKKKKEKKEKEKSAGDDGDDGDDDGDDDDDKNTSSKTPKKMKDRIVTLEQELSALKRAIREERGRVSKAFVESLTLQLDHCYGSDDLQAATYAGTESDSSIGSTPTMKKVDGGKSIKKQKMDSKTTVTTAAAAAAAASSSSSSSSTAAARLRIDEATMQQLESILGGAEDAIELKMTTIIDSSIPLEVELAHLTSLNEKTKKLLSVASQFGASNR